MSAGDHEQCEWMPLGDGRRLRVTIATARDTESAAEAPRAAVEAEWARLCARNPRYFNGPILAVEDVEPERCAVRVRRDEFKHLAVRPVVDTGVAQLGVTGVLEARDAMGRAHVLLGRRSHQTRVFGGMWELGPSGGVDAPPVGQTELDWADVWRVLVDEIREELGLPVEPDPAPPVALLADPVGGSVELVVRVPLVRPVEELPTEVETDAGTSRWEYDEVRWLGLDELAAFERTAPVIAATRAIWRGLGWL